MPPELRREQERTRRTKYEGPEPPKKRATKKRSGKQPVKQPAKRKRQQSINQADKPITDADKAVEAAQQLVAFKKFAVARQKAAKAVPTPAPAPVPAPAPTPTSSPNRPPPSAQPPLLEPEDLISSVAEIPEPVLPTPPAPRRAIHWSDPLSDLSSITDKPPSSPPVRDDTQEQERIVAKPYKIEWFVIVGKDRILSDRASAERFDVHRAVELGMELAEQNYVKDKYHRVGFEGDRGQLTATITAKNIKKFEQTIMVDAPEVAMTKINNMVIELQQDEKKDIRVSVEMRLAIYLLADEDMSSSTRSELGLPAGTPYGVGVAPSRSQRNAKNRESRQIAILEAADRATKNAVPSIEMRWKCRVPGCRNFDKCCYIFGNFGHVALNNRTLIKWNEEIGKGLATVDAPPAGVLGDLLAEQQRGRSQSAARLTGAGTMALTAGVPATGGTTNYFNIGAGIGSAVQQAEVQAMSSPPRHGGCDDDNLEAYVNWLVKQRPAQAVQLDAARERLRVDGWGYSKLRRITDAQWERTGIGAGTVDTLKERMRDWEGPKAQVEVVEEEEDGIFE